MRSDLVKKCNFRRKCKQLDSFKHVWHKVEFSD